MSNWRLLFIVEGIPTVILGVLTLWLLPDRPEETAFLNDQERKLQIERMNRGLKADVGRTVNKSKLPCYGGVDFWTERLCFRTYYRRFQGLEGTLNVFCYFIGLI